ncbi:hypothetical protein ACFSJS_22490 [Streptomyces desertarenae]|uniref:Uncharacterized protein n=1 Tax=Streptomyces desertarenae TaxID=2666184 RepID=A0ABW4PNS0_9ACTN
MATEIASNIPGRTIHPYPLLDEIAERHNLSDREAHEAIHAMLDQIADIDGDVVLEQRPIRPELLESNPHDLDVYWWLTVSDETAQEIRDALAAQYENAA